MEWQEIEFKGSSPSMRNSHRAVVKDSFLLIHGGRGTSVLKDTYVLDTDEGEWFKPLTKTAPDCAGAPARENHAAEYYAPTRRLYVFGGSNESELTNTLHALETETWTWEDVKTEGTPPTPRDRCTMTLVQDKLYVFGGHDEENEYLNDMYVFDLTNNKWDTVVVNSGTAPIPRHHHNAAAIGNKIYIFGGRSSSGCFNDLHVFDTESGGWSQPEVAGIFPAGRWGHTATTVKGSKIFFFGGWNGTWCFSDTNVFDAENTSWGRVTLTGNLPQARAYHTVSVIKEKLYLFGGRNGLRRMKETFVLDISPLLVESVSKKADGASIDGGAGSSEAKDDGEHKDATLGDPKLGLLGVTSWSLKDFEFKSTLGTGSFGRVRLAKHIPSGKICAVKMLKKSEIIRLKQVEHILAEKAILTSLDHPFIVNLYGSFQDRKYLYLIMEFVVGGEFFTHLRRAGRFNNDSSCFYAAQIVLIFQYLHSKDVVYRDLKPENLLLDHTGNIKLTDFGFAKKVDYRTWTLCGTPEYIAPEILLNKGHGKPVDWWALGILIYEMLAGSPPFVDDDPMGIYQKILAGRIQFPRYFDKHARDLIRKLLTADITKRLGNLKNGVEDIKKHRWFAKIDWTKLYNKEMRVPFVPEIRGMDNPHNFEQYPETTPDPPSIPSETDPFKDF